MTEPGACGDPGCYVLHADPSHPIHPPEDYREVEAAKQRVAEQIAAKYEWPIGKARSVVNDVIRAYESEAQRG